IKNKLLLVIIIFLLDAICAVHVQLIAPRYVKSGSTATLYCNHSVPEDELYKIEFIKDDEKIFQYIKERNPPFVTPGINGVFMEYSENGTTIKLRNVSFLASGVYSCAVSMSTPIYTKPSDNVQMKVIVPQTENPKITFEKSVYMVGENLEANCSSSAASPVPHLTWFINGKEVDVTLVHHYPHTQHKDLLSATAKLMIEVSALHAGDNGYLDISCHSTIPDYPMNHEEYADVRKKTVSIQITLASIPSSFAVRSMHELVLVTISCIICAKRTLIS
ncbi:junctional adhesion molecule 2A-like, partial [Vespula squamosa]